MVEAGSVIKAVVTKIEPYGIWLKYEGEKVLVLIPDVSWKEITHPSELARTGDSLDVFVLRYNYQDQVIVGSIKKLHPEENPYRELSRLPPGTPLPGKVDLVLPDELLVVLENGARGSIKKQLMPGQRGRGELVNAVISALDVEQGLLTLEPCAADLQSIPPATKQPSPNPVVA
jgi:ribosomal protein S1